MGQIGRGYKSRLSDLGCSSTLSVDISMAADNGVIIDVVCFGVDDAGRLSDDRYMVFFNQKVSPGGSIELSTVGQVSRFELRLDDLPLSVDRLVFSASIDGSSTMKCLGSSSMTVGNGVFSFSGADFDSEKAVIVGEIYRREGVWRFGAVGQGFGGGLSALLAYFGGTELNQNDKNQSKKVSLSKVTLTKPGERHTVSLVKGTAAPKKLVVRATWQDNGDGNDGNDDLDLRVGLLLADGRMKFISAPDFAGALDNSPYVRHLGDITSASEAARAVETVEVNADIASLAGGRVALVFSVYSAVGNGAVSVASLRPVMRMEYGDQVVECAYDFMHTSAARDDSVYTYVIGTAIIDGDKIVLGPSGLTSQPGSENTPWLRWEGERLQVSMTGPVIFKGEDSSAHNHGNVNQYS